MDTRERSVSCTTQTADHHEQVKWVKPELIKIEGEEASGKTYYWSYEVPPFEPGPS